ncbi:MAG: GNAT family N-acetyltransferase [Solirubrobacteraceae bacterium]|nr:GNAT family N-acetyltransferase [Patulibacter sp.]
MADAAIEVFRADAEDAEGIARVHGRARAKAYADLDVAQRGREPLPAERVELWRDLLGRDDDRAFTIVAEDGGEAVGFCSVSTESRDPDAPDGTGEIAALYVDPERWGGGIGAALMTQAVADLREAGCAAATLWVLAENAPAIRFYARFGFAPDGLGGPDPQTGRPKARLHATLTS